MLVMIICTVIVCGAAALTWMKDWKEGVNVK